MDVEEYKRRYGDPEDAAPGWDAIDARISEVYGSQEPRHRATRPVDGPIRADSDTALRGLAFVTDPTLGSIDTPHGRVDFVQAFGITRA